MNYKKIITFFLILTVPSSKIKSLSYEDLRSYATSRNISIAAAAAALAAAAYLGWQYTKKPKTQAPGPEDLKRQMQNLEFFRALALKNKLDQEQKKREDQKRIEEQKRMEDKIIQEVLAESEREYEAKEREAFARDIRAELKNLFDQMKKAKESKEIKEQREIKQLVEAGFSSISSNIPVQTEDVQRFMDFVDLQLNSAFTGDFNKWQEILDNLNNWKEIIEKYKTAKFVTKSDRGDLPIAADSKAILLEKLNKLQEKLNKVYRSGPWAMGQEYVREILKGNAPQAISQDQYLTNIVDISWYLYALSLALNKTQGYRLDELTYAIDNDCKKAIFEYLRKFPTVYDRTKISTHYKEYGKIQLGLDLPAEKRAKMFFAPYSKIKNLGKFHLLFGELDGCGYFIKPESYGFSGLSDKIGHAWELFEPRDYDVPNMAKEKSPGAQKLFENLLNAYKVDAKIKQEWKAQKEFGIKKMLEILTDREGIKKALESGRKYDINTVKENLKKEFRDDSSPEKIEAKNRFFNFIGTLDNLDKRKGREIHFSVEELLKGLPN